MRLSAAIADWIADEGVTTLFALMGDGNLQLVGEIEASGGVEVIHGRHENALLTMAHGYALMSGDVGVCTVTCGPGLAQVTTALTAAVRASVPLVLIAGETALSAPFHYQHFEPSGMIASTGATHIRVLEPGRASAQISQAFFLARTHNSPVVVTIPVDVQQASIDSSDYRPSTRSLVPRETARPDPELVSEVAEVISKAQRPCIVAGRGAVRADAAGAIEALATRLGAVVATTLPAQGFLDHMDQTFVAGIAGGFAPPQTRSLLRSADCVIAFGAGLGHFTTERGELFAAATVVQVDDAPRGLHEGRYVADVYLRGDARLAAEAIESALQQRGHARDQWCPDARSRPEELLGSAGASEYTTSPAEFVSALRTAIPREGRVVVGGGHFWSFVLPDFRVVPPQDLFITADFGAIAQALPFAVGGSCADSGRPHFVIEGDGGLLMHIQELETAVRQGSPCCFVIMNDGGYGAEKHMLDGIGLRGETAEFGYVDIAAVAAGFGARSATVTDAAALHDLVAAYQAADGPLVIDVRYSADWISASYQRMFFGSAGH